MLFLPPVSSHVIGGSGTFMFGTELFGSWVPEEVLGIDGVTDNPSRPLAVAGLDILSFWKVKIRNKYFPNKQTVLLVKVFPPTTTYVCYLYMVENFTCIDEAPDSLEVVRLFVADEPADLPLADTQI